MDPNIYIKVLYSCEQCGINNREVTVVARKPNEEVTKWVQNEVATKVGRDHFGLNPWCLNRIKRIAGDIKIPVLNDKGIGFPREN